MSMIKRKNIVLHLFPSFKRYGGAQKVIETLFLGCFDDQITSYLCSFHDYNKMDQKLKNSVPENSYLKINVRNLKKIKNAIIVSHDRKITSVLVVLSFFFKLKIIHVAHSVFFTYKCFSLFPKNIIAVSYAVKENLIDYFKLEKNYISVIYNGIKDCGFSERNNDRLYSPSDIKILHLGHIQESKQQLKIVEFLKDKLPEGISIHFAGQGKDAQKLQEKIKENGLESKFKYLGFCNDIYTLIPQYDYVLLFSQKEGLGLSIVEACMLGRPVITSAVGETKACGEVCKHEYNGFIANSFEELFGIISKLKYIDFDKYQKLCENARRVYEEKFNVNVMLKKYYSFFIKVLSE